jgi:ABC-type nickel/cobalt efflux system permease component RcnA
MSGLPAHPGFSFLLLGLLLGVKHALDADHVVAVSTIATENRSLRRACAIGFCWGVGHTAVLLVAGLAVLGLHLAIPHDTARLFEAGVGVMLVGLGLSVGWTLLRERVHVHTHTHDDGTGHLHVHSHREGHSHAHLHRYRLEYTSLAVGMMHGLAGSAALLLLVLSTVRSLTDGMLYILVFGTGSIAGMVLLGAALSVPFALTPERLVQTHLVLRALAGLASVSLGGRMLYEFLSM